MKRAFKVYGQARVALRRRGDVEQKRRPARTKVEKVAFIPAGIFPVKYEKERRKGLETERRRRRFEGTPRYSVEGEREREIVSFKSVSLLFLVKVDSQ